MKAVAVLLTFVAIAWASPSSYNVTNEWDEYKASFNKIYRSQKEEDRRLKTYMKTKQKIVEHNWKHEKGYTAFRMEINKFADWFPEELKKLNGFKTNGRMRWKDRKTFKVEEGVSVPEEVNWVKKGAVTSVKNQGACGSCYAFSAIGALEGLMYVTNKSVTDLSAQELVDCTIDVGNFGCDGGSMDHCFKYVKERRGISTKNSYPYEAREGLCRADRGKIRAGCTGFVDLKDTEEDLRKAVGTNAPVAVAFGVSTDFMYYKCGVFDGECASEPNHAMLVVGYGKDKATGKDYWLVKNSWGVRWGEKGYVKIERGVEKCGIHEYNSYPVYKKTGSKSKMSRLDVGKCTQKVFCG